MSAAGPAPRLVTAPAISVLTSVYNGERFLAAAIESVLAQDFTDFEFLLLDDGSTDGSLAIARRYAAQDSRLRVITRENRGLVASLNELLAKARAPLIARFDADDICMPGRLGMQKAFMDGQPSHGMVGSDTRYIDAAGEVPAVPPLVRPHDHQSIVSNLEEGPNLCHSVVMYRRALVLEIGGYRASYLHAEDLDLWLRLGEVTQLANLPEVLLEYRITPEQVSARHVVTQATHAAIAWLAHCERAGERPDPTAGLDQLPSFTQLDALFQPGASAYVCRRVIDRVLFSATALSGEAWPLLLAHAADHRSAPRLWRAAARLLRAGQLRKGLRLLAVLAGLTR